MKKRIITNVGFLVAFGLGYWVNQQSTAQNPFQSEVPKVAKKTEKESPLRLGAFSISLSVKDLKKSRAFYETLGFKAFGGSEKNNYLILKNGNSLIGLFQGMFEGNMLTFNPGWDENAQNVSPFDDVREIQKHLKSNAIPLISEVDSTTKGPGSIVLSDPDGNAILIDQHR